VKEIFIFYRKTNLFGICWKQKGNFDIFISKNNFSKISFFFRVRLEKVGTGGNPNKEI